MPSKPWLDNYDQTIADGMLKHFKGGGGALPEVLGIELVGFEPGKLLATATVSDELLTPFGNAHGGVLAAVMDHITGVVVYPLMPKGSWAATTEVKLNYIAPVQAGTLHCEAEVLAMTSRSAVVRGQIVYGDRLAAAGQGTLTVVPPKKK